MKPPQSDYMRSFVPSPSRPADSWDAIDEDWHAARCRFRIAMNGGSDREWDRALAVRDYRAALVGPRTGPPRDLGPTGPRIVVQPKARKVTT